ncbi:hypothetical protein CLF_105767 [Clonorchis sinensis]|uniref:Uncharacterized protein n=1 Tax=Clonorchis sinensis TaxID=79923 RepID=G7YE65_CLOSI|nr:hypothetical protein CLF_105767 [Clonorchis sinensis]
MRTNGSKKLRIMVHNETADIHWCRCDRGIGKQTNAYRSKKLYALDFQLQKPVDSGSKRQSQTHDNPRKDIYNSDVINASSPTTDVYNYGVHKPRDGIPRLCSNTDKNKPPFLDECAVFQSSDDERESIRSMIFVRSVFFDEHGDVMIIMKEEDVATYLSSIYPPKTIYSIQKRKTWVWRFEHSDIKYFVRNLTGAPMPGEVLTFVGVETFDKVLNEEKTDTRMRIKAIHSTADTGEIKESIYMVKFAKMYWLL